MSKTIESASRVHATLELARANKPEQATDKWHVFEVTSPTGKTYYSWARSYYGAAHAVFTLEGGTVKIASGPKETRLQKTVAALTDEQLTAMGLSRLPVPSTNGHSDPAKKGRKGKKTVDSDGPGF